MKRQALKKSFLNNSPPHTNVHAQKWWIYMPIHSLYKSGKFKLVGTHVVGCNNDPTKQNNCNSLICNELKIVLHSTRYDLRTVLPIIRIDWVCSDSSRQIGGKLSYFYSSSRIACFVRLKKEHSRKEYHAPLQYITLRPRHSTISTPQGWVPNEMYWYGGLILFIYT